jgi:hypothetical protein
MLAVARIRLCCVVQDRPLRLLLEAHQTDELLAIPLVHHWPDSIHSVFLHSVLCDTSVHMSTSESIDSSSQAMLTRRSVHEGHLCRYTRVLHPVRTPHIYDLVNQYLRRCFRLPPTGPTDHATSAEEGWEGLVGYQLRYGSLHDCLLNRQDDTDSPHCLG